MGARAKPCPDRAECFFADAFHMGKLFLNACFLLRHLTLDACYINQQRSQRLPHFVMEFPRERTALFFLRVHQSRRELLKVALAPSDLLIALVGLAFESKDVERAQN